MATDAQINANRQNAKLSTGPKTPEGKENSKKNAIRHGLTAQHLYIPPGEEEEFEALRSDLMFQMKPQGPLELAAMNNLIDASWRLHRCRKLEKDMAQGDLDPMIDPAIASQYERISRFAARAQRDYYRATTEIRALQTSRAIEIVEPLDICLPAGTDFAILKKRTRSARENHAMHKILKRDYPDIHVIGAPFSPPIPIAIHE